MLQYTAVGIQNISRMAVTRDDYWADLENLAGSIEYGVWNCSLDLPVRLVAISEGGIGGCNVAFAVLRVPGKPLAHRVPGD